MSGFTLRGFYGFGPASGDNTAYTSATDQERMFGLGLDYDMGPLSIGVVHHRSNDIGNVTNVDQRESAIAGTYNFGPAALYGTWQTTTAENAAGADTAKFRIWSLGATAPVSTSGLFRVMYARFDNKLAGATNNDAKSWGALYEHTMSKRTLAYVGYNHMSNNGLAAWITPAGNGNGGQSNVTVAPGGTSNGYGFGVIHKF